jgi:hypothetical protein
MYHYHLASCLVPIVGVAMEASRHGASFPVLPQPAHSILVDEPLDDGDDDDAQQPLLDQYDYLDWSSDWNWNHWSSLDWSWNR